MPMPIICLSPVPSRLQTRVYQFSSFQALRYSLPTAGRVGLPRGISYIWAVGFPIHSSSNAPSFPGFHQQNQQEQRMGSIYLKIQISTFICSRQHFIAIVIIYFGYTARLFRSNNVSSFSIISVRILLQLEAGLISNCSRDVWTEP